MALPIAATHLGGGLLFPNPAIRPAPSKALVPVKKAAAPTKAVVTPTQTTVQQQPPPAAPNYATLMAQASSQASKLAAAQIAAQVKAITDQQAADRATAAQQAAEINKASLAAAQFLGGLGDMAKSDYTAAVQNLGGMAGGFTGALRDTAQQAADAAQAQLSSIPGNEQQVVNRGNDLANLVYGVSGQIPANALATQGLGATELARAIPAQMIGYGQQQALGVIGAGNKDAAALNAQIAQIRATLPSTTSTYLSQFEKSAQDQITNARQARLDALQAKNIGSQIATRKATLKEKQKTDAAAAKADALKNAPRPDKSASADGYLRDQYGHLWTITKGGVKYAQPAPGFHFDRSGRPVADPKPTSQADLDALALRYTSTYHYRTDSTGKPILTSTGTVQPVGAWVLDPSDPSGQTVMPRPKPTPPAKPFVPKIDKTISAANHAITYWDTNTGQWVEPKDAKTGLPIPYDPNKPLALKLFNSNGTAAVFNQSTGEVHSLVDDNNVPLPFGTPKAPPTAHYGQRFVGEDGYYYTVNSLTGQAVKTTVKAPPKVVSQGTWSSFTGHDGNLWRINNLTNEVVNTGIKVPPKVLAQGTWSLSPVDKNGVIWRTNSKTGVSIPTKIPGRIPASSAGGDNPLTVTQKKDHTATLNHALSQMKNGIPARKNAAGQIVARAHPKIDRAAAIDRLRKQGYFTSPELKRLAMALLNKWYPRNVTVQSSGPLGVTATVKP
jgi:hypothetical protein